MWCSLLVPGDLMLGAGMKLRSSQQRGYMLLESSGVEGYQAVQVPMAWLAFCRCSLCAHMR